MTRAHAPRQVTGLGDIAKSYLKGWFVIDFASCIPVQYIMLLLSAIDSESTGGGGGGGQVKVTKILRLVKLAGLDEGLLSFSLSILIYTENPDRCNTS